MKERTQEYIEGFGADFTLGAKVERHEGVVIQPGVLFVRKGDKPVILKKNVLLRSACVIYSGCVLNESVEIGHGAVIGHDVVIGKRTQVWNYANLLRDIEIGKDVMVGFTCQIDPDVRIGDRTRIQPYSVMGGGARIGKDVFIGAYVCITNVFFPPSKKINPVVVEDNAILLSNITVLPGITIGEGAVISACSLVTKDVAPHEWVMGTPAKRYGTRDEYAKKMQIVGN